VGGTNGARTECSQTRRSGNQCRAGEDLLCPQRSFERRDSLFGRCAQRRPVGGYAGWIEPDSRARVDSFTSADGLPDDFIRSLLVDTDGSLWIGTRRGLTHWTYRNGGPAARIWRLFLMPMGWAATWWAHWRVTRRGISGWLPSRGCRDCAAAQLQTIRLQTDSQAT